VTIESKPISATEPPAIESSVAPFARLMIRGPDGQSIVKDVLRPTTLVGSQSPCNIQLVAPGVGPVHCVFVVEQGGLRVHALRTSTGTLLNGTRIDVAPVASGDIVRIDEFECVAETNLEPQQDSTDFAVGHARLVISLADGRNVIKDIFRPTTLCGSRVGCNIQLAAPDIAESHFLITLFANRLRIRDLRSRFPTRVNGRAVNVCTLGDGDVIEVGPYRARIETSIARGADEADDVLDARFGPSPAVTNEQIAQLEDERATLAGERQALESERTQLDRLRAELDQRRAELDGLREELVGRGDQLDRQRQRVVEESESLAATRRENEQRHAELLAERAALGREQAALRQTTETISAREKSLAASQASHDERRTHFDSQQTALQATDVDVARRAADCQRREQDCQRREEECRLREAAVESDSKRLAAEADRIRQLREASAQERAVVDRDRQVVGGDRSRTDAERSELVQLRQQIEADHALLAGARLQQDSAKRAADARQAEIDQQRKTLDIQEQAQRRAAADFAQYKQQLTARAAELETRGKSLVQLEEEIIAQRQAIETDRFSMDEMRRILDGERSELEVERHTLEQEAERLHAEAGALQARTTVLGEQAKALKNRERELKDERRSVEAEQKQLSSERSRLERDLTTLAARTADLEREKAELSAQAQMQSQLAAELKQRSDRLVAGEVALEQLNRDAAKRAEQIQSEAAAVASLGEAHEHRRKALEQQRLDFEMAQGELRSSLAALGEDRQLHESRQKEFERQRTQLLEEEAAVRAREAETAGLRETVDRDRARLAERQTQLDAGSQSLAAAERQLEQERQQIQAARTELDEQRVRLASEFAASENAKKDLAKSRENLDERERRVTESEADLSTQQITLAAEAERIDAEREHLEEWSERLRREQAFANAARKQFQTSVDEFRSENRRFEMAIGAIRVDRERHRRRRMASKQIAEDRALAELLIAEGILDEAQAEWFVHDQFGQSAPGGYEIVDFLARGEETWICQAIDPQSRQKVALKMLARPQASNAADRSRLGAEARVGQQIEHVAIVRTLVASGSEGERETAFLVMELVPGISLADLIGLHRSLPWRETCNYAFQAAVGLGQLHDAGIVHGDVQPANLLIDRNGGLKVADFGSADAAFLHGETGASSPSTTASLYTAPELWDANAAADAQSDIFSLGCTIYYALTGSLPFAELSHGARDRSASAPPAPLRSFVSDLPSDVIRIVKRMMAPNREARFASMNELVQALGPWARRQPAYFDRQAIIAQRAIDARARLRALAKKIEAGRQMPEPATAPER
jgi:tRNA A-37 threonylcarbamoyl transferase component Bud32/pSer/pThr/pTyr-binding forkhead associated (FHA) protein